ncbi:MAG: adenylate/guanylate cyclase domain-containing protein, partial [Deltaproteobacteria bacterium]|nr:adenylate/guanylate cyclase domain-containing protein [Deltaproteobacteria bacterium]
MTSASILLLIFGSLLIAILAVLWLRTRAESGLLRERLQNATRELERLQLSFTRFAPHEVIERIISDGISTAGEKKEVTVLFADLVGFTALSEAVDPSTLVRILNGYFARMSDAIIDNRGHISTFIGDGILAFYGTLEPNPWQ